MKLEQHGVKFFSKFQVIQIMLYSMTLLIAYMQSNSILGYFVQQLYFVSLINIISVLVRGQVIDTKIGGVLLRCLIRWLGLLLLIFFNFEGLQKMYLQYVINGITLIIFLVFSSSIVMMYRNIHKKYVAKIKNINFYRIQPKFEKKWYIASLISLLCASVLEEILRADFLYLFADTTGWLMLFIGNILFFEIYHFSDSQYQLNWKTLVTRTVLSIMTFILSFIFHNFLLSIALHLLYNSFTIFYIFNLYYIKEKGKTELVIKI